MKPLNSPPFIAVHQNGLHKHNSQQPKTAAPMHHLRAAGIAQPKLAPVSRRGTAASPHAAGVRAANPQTTTHACNHHSCASGIARRGVETPQPTNTRHATVQPVMANRKVSPAPAVNPTRRAAATPAAPSPFASRGRHQAHAGSVTPKTTAAATSPRTATPQRFENRALAPAIQKTPNANASAPSKKIDYMVHAPAHVGAGRKQIKVTIKGTQQVAGSVDISATSGGKVHISNLKVERPYRKRGIANQLMDAVINTARTNGYSGARLEARPSDDGISPQALVSMYQKLGFRNVGKSSRGNPLMERHLK